MSITIGFILIFVLIVIPGLLFQRFYYFGEFSKQFNTKDTVYKSIFYSVIPGILIQLLGALIYFLIHGNEFKNETVFTTFYEISAPPEKGLSTETLSFINNDIHLFLIHLMNVYILSIIIGYSLTTIVRYFNLDKTIKILRFKNQWYYIFSGEILRLKKFKNVDKLVGEIKGEYNKFKHYPPFADILVETNSDKPALYSGYVIDYDLDSNNINNLDKIYLIGAHRFRDKKDGDPPKIVFGSRAKVPIKGDVFVLSAKNIQNMNLTFVPKPIDENISQDDNNWQKFKRITYRILLLFKLLVILYIYFIGFNWFKDFIPSLTSHLKDASFFQNLLLVLSIVQLISLFSPEIKHLTKKDNEETEPLFDYSWKDVGLKFIALVILVFAYWLFYC